MPDVARVAVILAGGSGERFWPLSTGRAPKQLLSLTGSGKTLLEEAVERIRPLFSIEDIFIVTGERLAAPIREAALIPFDNVLVEPVAKNTLGALCWAAAKLADLGIPDNALMAVLTADHAIGDPERFRATVEEALRVASETHGLVTVGIAPTRPETGYGYIQKGEGYRALGFTEKPDTVAAQAYVASGGYLWNSGMFFWRLDSFRREIALHCPAASEFLDHARPLEQLDGEPIDRALMEKCTEVFVVAGHFPWDDLGAWDSLERIVASDERGNVVVGSPIVLDSSGSIVFSDGIRVGVVGLCDMIVVATENGILVCPKSHTQRVKEIVAAFRSGGGIGF